jgi:hypothetical protein
VNPRLELGISIFYFTFALPVFIDLERSVPGNLHCNRCQIIHTIKKLVLSSNDVFSLLIFNDQLHSFSQVKRLKSITFKGTRFDQP